MSEDKIAMTLQSELTAIDEYLIAANDVMKSGYMPDITGFDKRMVLLCNALKNAPKALQQQYAPRLMQLQEKLDAFEANMKIFHEQQMRQRGHGNA